MEKKKIYNLVIINEDMEIVDITSYTNEDIACKELNEDYKRTKEMLVAEGWGEDDLEVDDFTEGNSYLIQYGESSYYGEVYPSVLKED